MRSPTEREKETDREIEPESLTSSVIKNHLWNLCFSKHKHQRPNKSEFLVFGYVLLKKYNSPDASNVHP